MQQCLMLTFFLMILAPLAQSQEPKAPNFVFILADDQAWNGLSVPMIPGAEFSRNPAFKTPNIEKLAKEGMVFSQGYASHCKCECSRASILMGRSTTSLNATDKFARNWKAPASDSLANTLKLANPAYKAAHLGKWQWPQTPKSMGYDLSDGITQNEDGDTKDPLDPKQSFSITRRANSFIDEQVKEAHPFYLQLSYYAVHQTPQALESTLKKYANLAGGGGRGDRHIMAAMTEDFDTCVGEVLKKLDSSGISKNTFVIYMSDNGGRTGVLSGGKGNLYEGGIRVPVLVRGPGIKGGTYCNEPVVGYDLLATVLDLAAPGTKLPSGIEGGSWKPVLMNEGKGKITRPIDRLVFHQSTEVDHPQTALRKGDHKLLYYWDTRQAQLFDLAKDLREENDLADSKKELVAALTSELKAHVKAGIDAKAYSDLESGKIPPSRKKAARKGGK